METPTEIKALTAMTKSGTVYSLVDTTEPEKKPQTNRGRRTKVHNIEIGTNDSWTSLAPKAKLFCAHYVKSNPRSGIESALAAGYSGITRDIVASTASHLLADPRIVSYCRYLMAQTAVKLNYSREGQLEKIQKLLDICVDKKDMYSAGRFIEIENKLLNLYAPTTQLNINASGDIKVSFGGEEQAHSSEEQGATEIQGNIRGRVLDDEESTQDFTDGGNE